MDVVQKEVSMLKRSTAIVPNQFFRALYTLVVCTMSIVASAQTQSPQATQASAQMEAAQGELRAGSDLVFKMKLNQPLPEGARFEVRLSPTEVDQEISVPSGEPTNKERTEFLLKTKLPEKAVPGQWHIKTVWLFLGGTAWTNNTLATNPDFRFIVEGPKFEIPTKATATLVKDGR
jgi:hypothetical protein